MPQPSRYRPDAAPDYSHRYHAGNVGDVWKHLVLVDVLQRVAGAGRVEYVESHAGEGRYALGATGEWTEGIGRLAAAAGDVPDALARYLATCRSAGSERVYPGSPLLARNVLGPSARLTLWERDDAAAAALERALGGSPVTRGDGVRALADAVRAAEARADAVVALVDPPWVRKADWIEVPDALAAAARASRRATLLLWYPVKSLTRPNAMIARLRAAGVSASMVELVTTPLGQQRHRLNGSAVLLVHPPDDSLAAIAAAAPVVGGRCATTAGTWSFRMQRWTGATTDTRPRTSGPHTHRSPSRRR